MKPHVKAYLKHFKYGEQDFIRCEHCGKKAVDIHHIVYRSHGGKDEIDNLIALCRGCHEMAHNNELTMGDLMILVRRRGATTKEMGKNL